MGDNLRVLDNAWKIEKDQRYVSFHQRLDEAGEFHGEEFFLIDRVKGNR